MNWKSLKEVLESSNRKVPENLEEWPDSWKTIFYKTYDRSQKFKPDKLMDPQIKELTSLLKTRRSSDVGISKEIGLAEIFSVLYFSARENDEQSGSRTYPSGGALYPLEIYYINCKDQETLPMGLYHFNQVTCDFSLIKKLSQVNCSEFIGIKKDNSRSISGSIILTYSPQRNIPKYQWLGVRLALMEAGIIGQNISLVSQSFGIKTRFIGYIHNDKVNALLEIDGFSEMSIVALAISK